MWQWILLFIVLTPGVLFTIPPYGKKFVKGVSGKVVTAVLHGLVFVAAARFFMLCKEAFQGNSSSEGSAVQKICEPGTGGTGGVPGLMDGWSATCDTCPANTFSNGIGFMNPMYYISLTNRRCLPCPPGRISPSGSNNVAACVLPSAESGSRLTCSSGTGALRSGASAPYTWGTTCETCPENTFSSAGPPGAPWGTTRRCIPCPSNKTSPPGSNSPTACTGAARQQCTPGTGAIQTGSIWSAFGAWGTTCETCPANTFSLGGAGIGWATTRRCMPCDSNRPYSNPGTTSVNQCRSTP